MQQTTQCIEEFHATEGINKQAAHECFTWRCRTRKPYADATIVCLCILYLSVSCLTGSLSNDTQYMKYRSEDERESSQSRPNKSQSQKQNRQKQAQSPNFEEDSSESSTSGSVQLIVTPPKKRKKKRRSLSASRPLGNEELQESDPKSASATNRQYGGTVERKPMPPKNKRGTKTRGGDTQEPAPMGPNRLNERINERAKESTTGKNEEPTIYTSRKYSTQSGEPTYLPLKYENQAVTKWTGNGFGASMTQLGKHSHPNKHSYGGPLWAGVPYATTYRLESLAPEVEEDVEHQTDETVRAQKTYNKVKMDHTADINAKTTAEYHKSLDNLTRGIQMIPRQVDPNRILSAMNGEWFARRHDLTLRKASLSATLYVSAFV